MSLYHHLKTWLGKKREHPHEEETVAVPEFHTGKAKEKKISPLMYVLTVLFILKYVFL